MNPLVRRNIIIGVIVLAAIVIATAVFTVMPRGEFVGSSMSNKYHDPSCTWAQTMSPDRRVWFSDANEAREAGYLPCETCDPE